MCQQQIPVSLFFGAQAFLVKIVILIENFINPLEKLHELVNFAAVLSIDQPENL